MEIHFISGLPRSGSSLLASILRQNPAFTSQLESPLGAIFVELLHALSRENEAAMFITDAQKERMLRGIFTTFYSTARIPFDNNRRWCSKLPTISKIFPKSKMICCVRPLAEIVSSVERLVHKNGLDPSIIFNYQTNLNVYQRTKMLFAPEGLIGYAYNSFKEAYYGPFRDRLFVLDYHMLVFDPWLVMKTLHEWLGYPPFEYDFGDIKSLPGAFNFDEQLGTPGLHSLGTKVHPADNTSSLPPDMIASFDLPFWEVGPLTQS